MQAFALVSNKRVQCTTHPCCHEVTQSWVGTNPFLPTPAAAILSKLSEASKESDRVRSRIFPLAFSDLVVGSILVPGASGDRASVACSSSLSSLFRVTSVRDGRGRSWGNRASRSISADNPMASLLSVVNKRAFSCSGASCSESSGCLPFLSLARRFACSSLANCTLRISRRPRARVNVPRSSNALWDRNIAYMRLGFSFRWFKMMPSKTSSLRKVEL